MFSSGHYLIDVYYIFFKCVHLHQKPSLITERGLFYLFIICRGRYSITVLKITHLSSVCPSTKALYVSGYNNI